MDSFVFRTTWAVLYRTTWAMLLLWGAVTAQSVAPSNATEQQTASIIAMAISHASSDSALASFVLHVLTTDAAHDIPDGGLRGSVLLANASDQLTIASDNVALISCDPYSGNLQPSDVFDTAIGNNATAIVLYSEHATHCTAQDISDDYRWVYTMMSQNSTVEMLEVVNSLNTGNVHSAYATIASRDTLATNGTNSGDTGSNSSQQQNPLGPSPSTAVAMIILYSITGIITALFLGIIITGAVRAHRHPERYGPRNVIGRPRQSRARGIARAMLETIPIVKFGERGEVLQKPTDVELAEHGRGEVLPGQETAQDRATTDVEAVREADQTTTQAHGADEGGIAAAVATGQPETPEDNQGCSICTDDFEVGQDQRVLPCDHRFHPACIDPWLLNVSGTCPLCRIDLRPQTSNEESEPGSPTQSASGAEAEMAPPLGSPNDANARRRRSTMLVLMGHHRPERMTREERVNALRQLRTQQSAPRQQTGAESPEEEISTRRRLRNAFRIRTRRTGEDGVVSEEPEPESQDAAETDSPSQGTSAGLAGRA